MRNFWKWLQRLPTLWWIISTIFSAIPIAIGIMMGDPLVWSIVAGAVVFACIIWAIYGVHLLRSKTAIGADRKESEVRTEVSLRDRPEVIVSGITHNTLTTWEIANRRATAFNIKSDAIRCGPVSAVVEPISRLEPNEKIKPTFIIFDERHPKQGTLSCQWLEVIFAEDTAPITNYVMKLSYINAYGQKFESETDIVWNSEEKKVETAHRRIIAL